MITVQGRIIWNPTPPPISIPRPQLYNPTLDGNGGVNLKWTTSGAVYTIVFRAPSTSGPWTPITTTYNNRYIDYPPHLRRWYYKVINFNGGYTSGFSSVRSIYAGPVPPTTTLSGASDRTFPKTNPARLGFTFQTTIGIWPDPYVRFGIKEVNEDTNPIDIRVYVDGTKIFETNYNILTGGRYINSQSTNLLCAEIGHTVEVELDSKYSEDLSNYELEYLQVGRIKFIESYYYNDDSDCEVLPTRFYSTMEVENDLPFIAINTQIPNDDDTESCVIKSHQPTFSTNIGLFLDDDYEIPRKLITSYPNSYFLTGWDYIHRVELNYRILCPNGNYLSSENLNYISEIRLSKNPDEYLNEMAAVLETITFFTSIIDVIEDFYGAVKIPEYIEDAFSLGELGLAWLSFSIEHSTKGNIDGGDGISRLAFWETGSLGGFPFYPDNKTTMQVKWAPTLPSDSEGYYQLELNTKLMIKRLNKVEYDNGQVSYVTMNPRNIQFKTYYNVYKETP
ncbi:MAG: hypothetical protein EU547_07790 [Promethearchaeota archaeon]|nr:MAG: hypothetical protein EU547_07790 [Candidatus Lokiarchaeota archaeon]